MQLLWWSAAAGANQYSQSISGALTTSGLLVKQTGTSKSGTLASVGALVKQTAKNALAGTLTSAGALVKQTGKILSGALTSLGTLVKQTNKVLTGTLTDSGTLVKQDQKVLAGTLTSSALLVKLTNKILAGTLTSSGALTAIKAALKSVAGTLTSSGTLVKQDQKNLAGALTSAGVLLKSTQAHLAGTLTSAGALVKRTGKVLAGTVSSSGALAAAKVVLRAIVGTLTSSGTLTKQIGKGLAGALTASGSIQKRTSKGLTGVLTMAATVAKRRSVTLSGALTALGTLSGLIVGLGPAFIRFVNEQLSQATVVIRKGVDYLHTVLSNQPFAYWRLNDAGASMTDLVGRHTGTVSGDVMTQQPGVTIDGDMAIVVTNDSGGVDPPSYVEAAGFSVLNGTSTISLEAWFKIGPASFDPSSAMVALSFDNANALINSGTPNLGVIWMPASGSVPGHWWVFGEVVLRLSDASEGSVGADTQVTADGPMGPLAGLETGQQVHVVFTFDGTLGILYVNGVRVSSDVPFPTPGPATLLHGDRVWIGSQISPNDFSGWTGLIDEVAVYPTVLTAADVAAHFAARYRTHSAAMLEETLTPAGVEN